MTKTTKHHSCPWTKLIFILQFLIESSGHLNLKLPPASPPPQRPPPPAAPPKTEAKSDSTQACAPPNPCGNTMMPPMMINQPGIAGYQQQLPWGGVQGSLMISGRAPSTLKCC